MEDMNAQPDTKALAAIRPGDPKARLAAAIGSWWREPSAEEAGWIRYLQDHFHVVARLDRDGKVGTIEFEYYFDPDAPVEGIHMLMPEDEIERAFSDLKLTAASSISPYRYGMRELDGGVGLSVTVAHGKVTQISVSHPKAIYPERMMPLPRPTATFNVDIVAGLRGRGTAAPDGWCYGLPRGISPLQWPLSNRTGFPLEHHFTVRVPEPYRVKGPEFVALALFSETASESKRSDLLLRFMNITFDGRELPKEVDVELQPFLEHLRNRHPMEFRSRDILNSTFAVIWLTEEEFSGDECLPPAPARTSANAMCTVPDWLKTSAAERLFGWNGSQDFDPSYYLHRLAGRKPLDRWEILLLQTTRIETDPNTGRTPIDSVIPSDNPDGYVPRFTDAWNALGVELNYGPLHFGGTASPGQAMPDIGPFFIEFTETVGMLNLAGGNGQLDLVTMLIDWA